jgi:hypothetical protein
MLYIRAAINLRCIFDSLLKIYVRKSFDGGVGGNGTIMRLGGK